MKNQQGFAAILILALLPALISGFFMVAAMLGFLQLDLAMKHSCRQEGLSTQERVLPHLKKLLSLNPKSIKLKTQWMIAQAQLAAALASGNPAGIAAAKSRLMQVKTMRQTLEIQQKQLIMQSNLQLHRGHAGTDMKLLSRARDLQHRIGFLKIRASLLRETPPRLAVRPDSSDIAPTYSPKPDFESHQALAHRWQYEILLPSPLSKFLKGNFSFEKACAVTLTKGSTQWKTQITKGKFSLKSVW